MQQKNQTIDSNKLIQKCISGDEWAQRCLYDQYAKAMYHTIIRMLPFKADAEDVLQEVFIKVFQNLESFQNKSTVGAWIKKICINTTLKHLRKTSNTDYYAGDEMPELIENETEAKSYDVKLIHEKIKLLPQGCRVVLNLYLFEGYKHKEIAEALNISRNTSKSQLMKARKFIINELNNGEQYGT